MGKAHKFLIFSLLFFTSISINYCYDGDTCTSDKGEKIRLACIDAPELKGPEANPKKAKVLINIFLLLFLIFNFLLCICPKNK